MLYHRNMLAVVEGCSKDETRPALHYVLLEADGSLVATNGHVLFKTQMATKDRYKGEDYPSIATELTVSKEAEPQDNKNTLLHSDAVKSIVKAIPKKSHLPILANAMLVGEDNNRRLITTDLTNVTSQNCAPQGSDAMPYPDYEGVMPNYKKPAYQISISVKVLETLLKFVKSASKGMAFDTTSQIRFKFGETNQAIEFSLPDVKNGLNIEASGLIMPTRDVYDD